MGMLTSICCELDIVRFFLKIELDFIKIDLNIKYDEPHNDELY
jgi:hypothetical protein